MAKLNVENTKQWFTQDEAARYIFEGDDICASVLNEFLENNRLIRYIKLNYDYPIDLIFKPNDAPCFTAFHKINETSLNEAKIPVSSSLSLSSGEVVEVTPPKIFFLERYLPRGEYELKSDPAKNEIVVLTTDITVRYWLDNSGVYGWLDVPNLFKDKRNEVFNQYEQGGVSDALIYANGLEAYYQPTAEPKDITIDKSRLNEVRDFNKTEKGALFYINPRFVNPDNSFEVGYPRHELDRFIKAQSEPTPETSAAEKEPTDAHLAVIGVMLQMLITGQDNGVLKSDGTVEKAKVFKANNNQDAIAQAIETFSRDYVNRTGLSATTASAIFSKANKHLQSKKI